MSAGRRRRNEHDENTTGIVPVSHVYITHFTKIDCYTIKILAKLKYIEYHPGHYDSLTASGNRSRIRANAKLIKCFKSYSISTAMITNDKDEETIILKKSKDESINPNRKDLVDYIDNPTTNKMIVKINIM